MKLSFSTRGWGNLSWEELLESALDMKFSGIEVYNIQKFPALTDLPWRCSARWRRTRQTGTL